jgi:membrane protease YdiL (CAAX protease family)
MSVLLNLALSMLVISIPAASLGLWVSAAVRLYNGQPILAPQARSVPQVGLSELLIGFGVLVLVSGALAPLIPQSPSISEIVTAAPREIPSEIVPSEQAAKNAPTATAEGAPKAEPNPESEPTENPAAAVSNQRDSSGQQDSAIQQDLSDQKSADAPRDQKDKATSARLKESFAKVIISSVATTAAVLAILFWMRLRRISAAQSGFVPTWHHIAIGFVAAVMILPPVMALQGILASLIKYEHPALEILQQRLPWTFLLLIGISSSIVAPVVEELYFRGIMQGWLDRLALDWRSPDATSTGMAFETGNRDSNNLPASSSPHSSSPHSSSPHSSSPHSSSLTSGDLTSGDLTSGDPSPTGDHPVSGSGGVSTGERSLGLTGRAYWPGVLTSLLFALVHLGQGPAPISLFFLALGIAYLYRQTGSIWPGIIVHFTLNALSTTMAIVMTQLAQ